MSQGRERILFVTGRLAAPALENVVGRLAPAVGFDSAIHVAKISVAALITTDWLARFLAVPPGTDRVVLPGASAGNLAVLQAKHPGVRFERGPDDLLDLPEFFQQTDSVPIPYGDYDIEILTEINHANRLPRDELLRLAHRHRDAGADLIDLGCTPGEDWPELAETVRRLKGEGLRVSIDTFDADQAHSAARAGAELVLSVNSTNVDRAADWGAEVIAIPDHPSEPGWLDELSSTTAKLTSAGVPFRVDPVLDPIGFGFAQSLGRFLRLREAMPDVEMLMGVGNVTELTEVDSAGVNAVLVGICQELGIRSILSTEVIGWARSSTRELDVARRLMHFAVMNRRLPKHVDSRLVMLRDPRVRERGQAELERLQASIKDPNIRLFAESGKIIAMNREFLEADEDAFRLFERLGVQDPAHSFYLGWEMSKASLAMLLGKQYTQDQALRWGLLTRQERSHRDRADRGPAEPDSP